jgi:nitroreductase
MTLLDVLDARISTPSSQMTGPGPDHDQLLRMLRSAVRVPDHGRLTPWRFVRIHGDARQALGDVLARRCRERDPDASNAVVEKDRQRFNQAPLVVAVVGCIHRDHRIPEVEQVLSGGCVCFALLLAAQGMGFGAQWLTGWAAYDPGVREALGVAGDEQVLGFIHIGTAPTPAPERLRPDPAALLTDWTPA